MNREIQSNARSVVDIAEHFNQLKITAKELASSISDHHPRHYTPLDKERIQALLIAYWKPRCALLELIQSIRQHLPKTQAEDQPTRAYFKTFPTQRSSKQAVQIRETGGHNARIV